MSGPPPGPVVGPPVPPQLRVLVKGASTVNWVSFMGGSRADLAYPRGTEHALRRAGWDAQVRDTSLAAEHPHAALRTWQREVVTWSPDVVVLHYGHMECIHLLLPTVWQRHAQSLRTRPGAVRDRYRQHVVRPGWKLAARAQQQVDRRLPPTLLAHRPRRVAADLGRLVERVRTVGSPLVLLMELTRPGRNYADWFPGIGERLEVMNAHLRGVVEAAGSEDVRLFGVRDVVGDADPDVVSPDGAHFSPRVHAAIAESLAAEIGTWAAAQPHLRG